MAQIARQGFHVKDIRIIHKSNVFCPFFRFLK